MLEVLGPGAEEGSAENTDRQHGAHHFTTRQRYIHRGHEKDRQKITDQIGERGERISNNDPGMY